VRLADMGHALDDTELDQAFSRFKELADRKKVITDLDLEALIADEFYQPLSVYSLDGLQVSCGTMGMPTAAVRLKGPDGKIHIEVAIGTGPVDAAYKAINSIISTPNNLLEFSVHAVTEGIDALGEVTVRVEGENGHQTMNAQKELPFSRIYGGHGADTDIIVASAKAYINALNKLIISKTEMQTAQNDYGVMLVG
jgi:2-isopropylmalate synthase